MNIQGIVCTKPNCTEVYLRVFSENLNHARHVENERLIFSSIYIPMSAALFTFATNLSSDPIALPISFITALMGFIGILITKRWDHVLDHHRDCAKQNYEMLCQSLRREAESQFECQYLAMNALEYPEYCFHVSGPDANSWVGKIFDKIRARQLFLGFHYLLEFAHAILFFYLLVK